MSEPLIYLDHAATTPVRHEIADAMLPYLTGSMFGNPSSAHRFGREASAAMERARREIGAALGCESADVIFTSGGTEADNLAVIGSALAARASGARPVVVTTAIEHKAVLAAARAGDLGLSAEALPVDGQGIVNLAALDEALARGPAVVSIMWVNNEVGVVQPIAEIASRCRRGGVPLHSDGVQAVGKLPVDLRQLPGIMLSLSGHKLGAPKGIGALIVPDRKALRPLLHGGGHQGGLRAGTENVAGAVALGRAVRLAVQEREAEAARLQQLRDQLAAALVAAVPDTVVLCADAPRAPHILALGVPGADGQALVMYLDLAGVAASAGSACSSGATEPSHVMRAIGVPLDLARGYLRLSLGHATTAADVERAVPAFVRAVQGARKVGIRADKAEGAEKAEPISHHTSVVASASSASSAVPPGEVGLS